MAAKRRVPADDRRTKLAALLQSGSGKLYHYLQSWIDDPDANEQEETGDFLARALDEDRPSERKLFPP